MRKGYALGSTKRKPNVLCMQVHLLGVRAGNLLEDRELYSAVRHQVERMLNASQPFLCHMQSYYDKDKIRRYRLLRYSPTIPTH